MKIKSNVIWNLGILKAHQPSVKDGKVVIGGGMPKSLNIVAGSTIELNDQEWLDDFAEASKDLIEDGALTIVEDVKLSKEDKAKAKKAKSAKLKAEIKALDAEED
jgi:3-phosphoglycerate kinase